MSENPTKDKGIFAADVQVGQAATNKIKRTGYRDLATFKFVDWFNKMVAGLIGTPFFEHLVPDVQEWVTMNGELQALYAKRKTEASHSNVAILQDAVSKAKVKADIVSDYLETKYPGNIAIASAVLMEYNKKSSGTRPAPVDKITELKAVGLVNAVRITWKPLPLYPVTYKLYQSLDEGATFSFVDTTTNSKRGFTVSTKRGVGYKFYIVAAVSSGTSPQSDHLGWYGQ